MSGMSKKIYRLYHYFGGFDDCHKYVGTCSTFKDLLKLHISLRKFSPLYNYPELGNDYFEELELKIPNKKRCVYRPK